MKINEKANWIMSTGLPRPGLGLSADRGRMKLLRDMYPSPPLL